MSNERNVFKAREVHVMSCTPANLDHDDGEPATIFVLGRENGDIEQCVIGLRDSRFLALSLLISLYSSDDPFAARVLEQMFPVAVDGQYCWPTDG